eukprot:scaffold284895_cov17-Prasinocladus_malaysianus.AAC.1
MHDPVALKRRTVLPELARLMPKGLTYTVWGGQAPIDADIDDDGAFNWSLKIPQACMLLSASQSLKLSP